MTVTTYHNMNYYTSMLVKFPATGNIKLLFQNLSMYHLFSFQTQYVWWMGVLTDGESCSTGQVGSGQRSALKAGTLRTPLSSAHTLAIPRESEYQMYCCYLAFSLVCYTWPPTVTGWTVLGRGISLSLCFPPQCTLPTHETNGKRPLVPVNPAVHLRSGQSCR